MEEFLASLDGLETCAAILVALMQFVRAFGMDSVAIGELPSDGVSRLPSFFYSTWPQAWRDIYVEQGLAARDPLVPTARRSLVPFTWSELNIDDERWRVTREQLKVFDLIHEFGWTEGFAVPIHGPGDHHGVVSYAGTTRRLDMSARAVLHLVSLYVYDRMFRLHKASAAEPPHPGDALTDKEHATLRLLAAGRTDKEIAVNLGVAERTVLYYVRSIRTKLGCQTRAQLIAEAIRIGIIS